MLCLSTHGYTAPAIYAQLSSSTDQVTTLDNLNSGIIGKMENIDGINGIGWDQATNEITVKEDGVYFIMAVAQIGARESAKVVKGGDIYFWLECNNQFVPKSGNWTFAGPDSRAHSLTNQAIIPLKSGDKIRVMFASSAPEMGMITFKRTEKWPAAPGISFSMWKIGDVQEKAH